MTPKANQGAAVRIQFAIYLLLSLLTTSLFPAYPLNGAPEADAPLAAPIDEPEMIESRDVAGFYVFLPIITKPGLPSPGDTLIVSWAQVDDGGSRDVLLHWRTPPEPPTGRLTALGASAAAGHAVDRRRAGETTWQTVGQAGFASDAAEMEAILGADLTQQLGYDLSGGGTPLTAQEIYDRLKGEPALVQVLAQAYYKVGLAAGTSFIDRDAPGGVTLEYQVRDLGSGGTTFEPASVPPTDPDIHPAFNLRETWTGPTGLGQAPSPRPADAPERYSWQMVNDYRPWDGQVYLIWDVPEEGKENDGEMKDGRVAINIAGYRVYRSAAGRNRWASVNPKKARCATQSLCEMLVGVAPTPYGGAFPPHYFVDDLHDTSPDPGDVYNTWDYKVCAVDMLGSDIECSQVLTVDVRELQPPAAVQDIRATVPEDQSEVTISWNYSDTLEVSPPLRFYVTRSPTLTAPMEDWTVVKDKNSFVDYIEIPNTGPVKKSIIDYPPRDQVFWYRVQVRDDAGNWSSEGIAVKAARYTRTPPSLPEIQYNKFACANNPLPFTLSGLDDNVFLINLYRSFEVTGTFELVERFEVTRDAAGNRVVIDDDFLPPYPTYAYYRLEAVDDHGNVSVAEEYCAQLGDGPLMDPGLPSVTTSLECPPESACTFVTTVNNPAGKDVPVGVEVTQPGEDGVPITVTEGITESVEIPVNHGAWINLRSWYGYGDPTISNTITTWDRVLTNEFLDSDRNLTGLGPVVSAEWMTDTQVTPYEHFVRIRIIYDDSWTPPVAVFRRATPGGSWMQISPLESLQPHWFEDRQDPSPDQRYEYAILVLGLRGYELLGYWTPITVDPLEDNPRTAKLSGGISPPSPIDPACDKWPVTGGPTTISLQNGWELQGVTYWVADDGDPQCPTYTQSGVLDLDHAYGAGTLTNGSETWPDVEFQDIAIDGTNRHVGGRIVATLDTTQTPSRAFRAYYNEVEFTSTDVKAEVEITLPPGIKAEIPGFDRTDTLFGVFSELLTNYRFDPLTLGAGAAIIDESLPWQLHTDVARIDEVRLDLGTATTSWRLVGGGTTNRPDRNLAFMRPTYESTNADITADGLTGDFATGEKIEYATSFPASFVVTGQGGLVSIADSQITGGELWKAQASLTYESLRTETGYVVYNRTCDARSSSRYSYCHGFLGTRNREPRTLVMTPDPTGSSIMIGPNGYLSATVTVDRSAVWPSFETDPGHGTLFIAPAAFPDAPTTPEPMPAEAAWQRLPDPDTGGTFDPGLNLNSDDVSIHYTVFEPSEFRGSAMNLYVRKGGVSGHIIMDDTGPRTNLWGYSENVRRIELQFLDNAALQPLGPFITDLTLPYPTDATLPLTVTVMDELNRPLSGVFRQDPFELTHRYWSFTESPTTWVYDWAEPGDYTTAITGVLTKVLQLQNSVAAVPGLQPADAEPTTADAELIFNSEWLPDGDIGALRLLWPDAVTYRSGSFRFILSAVKLSRYYSSILNHTTPPSTLGIDLDDTMDTLPEEVLDSAGNLTGASLAACAAETVDGCGFIVLDGDVGVDYFGEVKSDATALQAVNADIPAVDDVVGEFPLAVNIAISATKFVGVQSGRVPWVWPVLNQVLDVDLPVKFLGNTQGGILVALLRNAPVLPGTEIFKADVAGIVDIRWDQNRYNDQVGLYLGYGAAQAAFRGLAMNRPRWSGGIRPYDQWSGVSGDVRVWAEKFGYAIVPGAENDPIDLAEEIWPDWCTTWAGTECTDPKEYGEVFAVIEPVLKGLDGQEAYGVTGVREGAALAASNVAMNTGSLTAVLRGDGLGLELTRLEGGGRIQWDIWDYSYEYEDIELVDIDFFLRANWLRFEMDRDGEIEVLGDTYTNLLYDWGIDANIHALATPVGVEWRFEGVVDAEPIGIAGLSALELDGTFGSGPYVVPDTGAVEYVSYFGTNFEAYFLDYRVGGGLLYGVVPQESVILREAGFGEIMDTLGNQGSYAGIYAYLFGDFPLAGDTCMLKANAGGEIRFWYYWSDEIWGGTLTGFVHATAACVLSARGQLELGYARLDNGGQMYNRTCTNSTCDIYGGSFWIATGVGWCSPGTWHRWRDRWWGDSWCYCIGAYVDLSYMTPGGLDYSYDLDYE